MSLKLKAVEYAEKTSKEAAARYFGVDDKSIWEWSSQRQVGIYDKTAGEEKRKRLHGAGRKALDVDMEEALFSWIVDLQDGNLRVSRKMLRQHARSLMPSSAIRIL